jgi:hypothetical protein
VSSLASIASVRSNCIFANAYFRASASIHDKSGFSKDVAALFANGPGAGQPQGFMLLRGPRHNANGDTREGHRVEPTLASTEDAMWTGCRCQITAASGPTGQ